MRILGSTAGGSDRPHKHVELNLFFLIYQHVLDLLKLRCFALEMEDMLYETSLAVLEPMYQVKTFWLTGPRVAEYLGQSPPKHIAIEEVVLG